MMARNHALRKLVCIGLVGAAVMVAGQGVQATPPQVLDTEFTGLLPDVELLTVTDNGLSVTDISSDCWNRDAQRQRLLRDSGSWQFRYCEGSHLPERTAMG